MLSVEFEPAIQVIKRQQTAQPPRSARVVRKTTQYERTTNDLAQPPGSARVVRKTTQYERTTNDLAQPPRSARAVRKTTQYERTTNDLAQPPGSARAVRKTTQYERTAPPIAFYGGLRAFAELRKTTFVSSSLSVRLSVRPHGIRLPPHWTDFDETLYSSIFRKSENSNFIEILKNNGYFT
jgi:hypothetical protein